MSASRALHRQCEAAAFATAEEPAEQESQPYEQGHTSGDSVTRFVLVHGRSLLVYLRRVDDEA